MGSTQATKQRMAIVMERAPEVLRDHTLNMKQKGKKLGIAPQTVVEIAKKLNIPVAFKRSSVTGEGGSLCWHCTKSNTWDDCIWPAKPVPGAVIDYKEIICSGTIERLGIVITCPDFVKEQGAENR